MSDKNLLLSEQDLAKIHRLELLLPETSTPIVTIENLPENRATLRIYYTIAIRFGGLGPNAVATALALYGQQAHDAALQPGRYPHIDRLFKVLEENQYFTIRVVYKQTEEV